MTGPERALWSKIQEKLQKLPNIETVSQRKYSPIGRALGTQGGKRGTGKTFMEPGLKKLMYGDISDSHKVRETFCYLSPGKRKTNNLKK